jgi:predicted Zn-dependent protease with MMP-like domain
VISLAPAEFEELVSEALDTIPAELTSMIENCVIVVEDYPPPDQPGLLGLYEGIPLTERGEFYSAVLPDKISIYRHPTLAICDTMEDVIEEVHITVVHEIAHHFGIDDARLRLTACGGNRARLPDPRPAARKRSHRRTPPRPGR